MIIAFFKLFSSSKKIKDFNQFLETIKKEKVVSVTIQPQLIHDVSPKDIVLGVVMKRSYVVTFNAKKEKGHPINFTQIISNDYEAYSILDEKEDRLEKMRLVFFAQEYRKGIIATLPDIMIEILGADNKRITENAIDSIVKKVRKNNIVK